MTLGASREPNQEGTRSNDREKRREAPLRPLDRKRANTSGTETRFATHPYPVCQLSRNPAIRQARGGGVKVVKSRQKSGDPGC
ncbi:hypothetical protein ANO11243_013220 [Dothideomycetidae sp. 11243]|nr:hypothetical protein ANO11243_013220 [fungal sp. No.11243]